MHIVMRVQHRCRLELHAGEHSSLIEYMNASIAHSKGISRLRNETACQSPVRLGLLFHLHDRCKCIYIYINLLFYLIW